MYSYNMVKKFESESYLVNEKMMSWGEQNVYKS